MPRFPVRLLGFLLSFAGCASDLNVYSSGGSEAKGVPFATPVLVKITTTTRYGVDPSRPELAAFCSDDAVDTYQVLPLGDLYFVDLDPAEFGKAEFAVEFTEAGLLKAVKLNSDARTPETIEAAAKLLGSVAEVAKPFGMAGLPESAQQTKSQHCIVESQSTRIERARLP